jgi:hypothetical protein
MSPKVLLRTPIPQKDESLAGYLIRLSESNYYDSPNWILQLAGLPNNRGLILQLNSPALSQLGQLIQLNNEQLIPMAFLPYQVTPDFYSDQYTIDKFAIKLCPYCLIETAYCRQIWDWKLVTVCSLHQCVLIQKCPGCQKKLRWARAEVAKCRCGFDFRSYSPQTATPEQVDRSIYLSSLQQNLTMIGDILSKN